MNTLLLLIDFYGHPGLTTDDTTDTIRYSHLTKIISLGAMDRNKFTIFTTHINHKDHRLQELKRMAINKGLNFIEAEQNQAYTLESLASSCKPEQVIVTGTNTSGCVFKNNRLGAFHWAKAGYKTKIYLPMCCEYEEYGVNDFERNLNSFAQLYNLIKTHDLFDITITRNISRLELPIKDMPISPS